MNSYKSQKANSNTQTPYLYLLTSAYNVSFYLALLQEGCIEFRCPISETKINNFCIPSTKAVTGLALGLVLRLRPLDNIDITSEMSSSQAILNLAASCILKEIKRMLYLSDDACETVHFQIQANTSTNNLANDIIVNFKLESTSQCSVERINQKFSVLSTTNPIIHIVPLPGTRQQRFVLSVIDKATVCGNFDVDVTFIDNERSYSTTLDPLFHCPKVVLNMDLYDTLVNQRHIISSSLNDHRYSKSVDQKFVHICYTDYLEQWFLTTTSSVSKKSDKASTLQANISFVSTVISIISIIAVLVTYTLFSELRFIPGQLLMVLCCNLLFAQILFAFGIYFVKYDILCKIVGFCSHVFWLATIMSMNACLWLMFKTLKKPLGNNNRAMMQSRSSYTLCRLTMGCYVIPLLMASLNIIIARTWYNDNNSGYGGIICFINITTLKLVTFIGPIVLVLLVNFFMFAIIMSSISLTIIKSDMENPNKKITVFFKLATMTGIFWFFGFLYEATGYSVFEYLFIILNGGHGFFLMWSFLFNSRVLELYTNLYRKHRRKHVESFTLSYNGSIKRSKDSERKMMEQQASSDRSFTLSYNGSMTHTKDPDENMVEEVASSDV